ncbi:MAG TPA: ABC transporter substrate-binding protein [Candidatus Binatia bacterium]|nr:ABC transporter substrate-binding protein [Candidatus Binatia bacterium]
MLNRSIAQLVLALLVVGALPARGAEEPYDFYAILSLSGPAAFLGRGEQITLGAAERYINASGGIKSHPIHFVVQDDQSSPAIAVQLASQVFAKHVPAFIGPSFGATCTALLPLVNNGPVMYCLANVIHPPNGSYAFSANPSTKDFTAAAFRYLKAKGVRKIALLTSTDASGQDGEQVALDDLRSPEFADLQLVANEHFATSDLTVAAQIARIKAAGAQAIDAWTTGTPFGTVLRGVQEGAYDGIVMTNGGNINKTQMGQYAQFIPRDMIFTAPPYMTLGSIPARVRQAKAVYLEAMRQIGVTTPDQTQLIAWDPMLIMIDALRHIGLDATSTQIRDYMLKLHDFAGINGMYDFRRGDQRGVDPLSSPIVRWDKAGDTFVTISKPGGLPL